MTRKLQSVVCIDYRLEDRRVHLTRFDEPDTLLGYDLIIWDLVALLDEFATKTQNGMPVLPAHAANDLRHGLERRLSELREHIDRGRPVVLLLPAITEFRVLSGDPLLLDISGSTKEESLGDYLADWLEIEVETTPGRGQRFEISAGEPFASFWATWGDLFTHEGWLRESSGLPLAKIQATNRTVAAATTTAGGACVLCLPSAEEDFDYPEEDPADTFDGETTPAQRDFLDALWELCLSLGGEDQLPEWTDQYRLPGEASAAEKLEAQEARLSRLEESITQGTERLRLLRRRKLLLTADGTVLERLVHEAFVALGFEVEHGAPGRSDRLVRLGRRVAVVEIKGKSKSASERDAAQLQKWVSDYHSNHARKPKGILVVNAWKGRPLAARTEPAFPKQMLKFAADEQQQCLLTSAQLLGLWLEAETKPSRKRSLANSLLSTVGVYPAAQDWTRFLESDESNA